MLESNNLVTFEGLANSSAYHTFLLDEEKGRLIVGAKDHIFSFNLLNISKDYAQVKTMYDFQTGCLVVSCNHVCKSVCDSGGLNTCLKYAPIQDAHSGAQVSLDSLFCFLRKVPHEYFRPGLSHTITRCARHVSCSLHAWVNDGVN